MRPAYLAEVCAGDNELRRDVELLLERAESRTESISYRYAKLTVGTQLGPYRVEAKIGEGGMGEVWKARDTRLDRVVALKTSKEGFSERFAREARAVAALNHPHVCHLYDVGSNCLVMEYIEGTPLKGPLPLDKAFAFSDQILDALSAAHRKGITHRDLKPSNILVTAAGIKLLDFGLAKQAAKTETESLTGATAPGQIVGTLQYMAPEQLRGEETDARTDIFAFGCVLYELISGKPAFAAENQAGVIAKILERAPEPLEIPKPIERILNTCLAKDPTDRFQTAVDLRRICDGQEIQPLTPVMPRHAAASRFSGSLLSSRSLWLWEPSRSFRATILAALATEDRSACSDNRDRHHDGLAAWYFFSYSKNKSEMFLADPPLAGGRASLVVLTTRSSLFRMDRTVAQMPEQERGTRELSRSSIEFSWGRAEHFRTVHLAAQRWRGNPWNRREIRR